MNKKKVNLEDLKGVNGIQIVPEGDNHLGTFYCYQIGYSFPIPKRDEKGNYVYKFDSNGNNKQQEFLTFDFKEVLVFDQLTKKPKANSHLSRFVVTKETQQSGDVLKYLENMSSPRMTHITKIVTEEDYTKKLNPAAFELAETKKSYESQIAELEAKLAKAESRK